MPQSKSRKPIRWPIWILAGVAATASAKPCEELESLALTDTDIVSARVVAAGGFEPPSRFGAQVYASLPEFCRVEAVSRPAEGSEIGIEVWLPAGTWNGKLEAVGNGAWAGSISHSAMAGALAAGYAAASTDTGHRGGTPGFALEHPDKLIDFAHRAVHQMALVAKAVTEAHYERPQERAYFAGCSTGGRQALTAAQRYPKDFDGIVAGAPAYYPSHIQGMQVWTGQVSNRNEAGKIGADEFRLINDAAIAACDTIDGVADGVIEDPQQCDFDPAELACGNGSDDACLAPEQIETVALVYQGPTTSTGDPIFPGLERGSELGWGTLSGAEPLSLARETYELLVYGGSDWDWQNFNADIDFDAAVERIGPLMNSNDADIGDFVERGGKLLLYHGWNDPGIPPGGTIRYYGDLRATLGDAASDASVRLFMVPGMNHCAGGTGTDQFDPVAALDRWIASDQPPPSLPAERRVNGESLRTRPLCPYPSVATYDGTGSTDLASNFSCR